MPKLISKIEKIDSHRNGVAGNGFHVVLFTMREGNKYRKMVGVVFGNDDEKPLETNGYVAVFDRDLLASGNITFGENSWRGDDFEPELRAAIEADYQKMIGVASIRFIDEARL